MSLGKETTWTFESNLNLNSITNLKKRYMQQAHSLQFIHSYFSFLGDETYTVWLTHLFRTDWASCYLRWTPCGVQQAILLGRVALGKFKSRKLHTVDTLADFCMVEWCNSWYFTCQNFLWEWLLLLENKEAFYISTYTSVILQQMWTLKKTASEVTPFVIWKLRGDDYAERHQKWSWNPSLYQTASDRFLYPQEGDGENSWSDGWLVCWFISKFRKFRDPKKRPQRVFTMCLQMFTISFFWESSSISDCNDLCFKIL